jgi:hypothetical protein
MHIAPLRNGSVCILIGDPEAGFHGYADVPHFRIESRCFVRARVNRINVAMIDNPRHRITFNVFTV